MTCSLWWIYGPGEAHHVERHECIVEREPHVFHRCGCGAALVEDTTSVAVVAANAAVTSVS